MKKIFYIKETSNKGRVRYVPVSEFDSEYVDSLPKGNHLISVYLGGKSRRYNIDPAYAPLIAAGRATEDVLANALVKAGELRMQRKDRSRALTSEEKEAWENLVRVFGDSARQLEWPSAREVAEEGMKALQKEANELLTNEAVKKAYEHFILLCKLAKEKELTNDR